MINRYSTQQFEWLDVTDLNSDEQQLLLEKHQIKQATLAYATDTHERARYSLDLLDNSEMIIFNIPQADKEHPNQFTISPITFLIKNQTLFSFHSKETSGLIKKILATESNDLPVDTFVLRVLFDGVQHYHQIIEHLSQQRDEFITKLDHRIQNRQLIGLSEIEKSLVYILSGTQTNLLLLKSLSKKHADLSNNKDNQKLITKLLVEAKQAEQMAKISLDVTERLSATSNNLLNNNLNDTMKFLTVWSLVLTIPTITTGFYGMNTVLPFSKNPQTWVLICLITLLLMLLVLYYLKKHRFI
ncbi:MAG: magnesium transporter CorA family protein [Liquorilactobacillus ghanensis]|uniref:magnesium transporter CorA family protein n=1 Tax=Liquorilactobacillus TaxID=2767888 RepID=UPI0039E8DCE2